MKEIIKKICVKIGLQDHLFTPSQIFYRTLRNINLGKNVKFYLTSKLNLLIKKEAKHAFNVFSKNKTPVKDFRVFLELSTGKKCFLDLGALYGVYSLSFSKLNTKSKAFGFDPSPVSFKTLKYHKQINKLENLKVYNKGVGDKNGTLRMKYEWIHLTIVDEKTPCDHIAKIITLDDFIKKEGVKPDIIKIDTEGSEYNILKGGEKYLIKNSPIIFLELHVSWLKNIGVSHKKIYGLIKNLGFEVYDYNKIKIKNPLEKYKNLDNYSIILSKKKL